MTRDRVVEIWRESRQLKEAFFAAHADAIVETAAIVAASLRNGGKLLLFGNGGSAADAQHVAAELVGRFRRERAPLPAIALTTDTSALTAIGNDFGFDRIFEMQLQALGRPADVAIAISTSGGSANVVRGAEAALAMGMRVVALTGGDGGALARICDPSLVVSHGFSARVQEVHIMVGHILCELVEDELAASTGETR